MSDIFISYAGADRSKVKLLVDELQKRGWSVWWDPTILPGQRWADVIEAALSETRCVIVLWSRASIQSRWVRAEADHAWQREILVPALLDAVIIPMPFGQTQAANLVKWSGVFPNAEFDKLAEGVTKILAKGVPLAPQGKVDFLPEYFQGLAPDFQAKATPLPFRHTLTVVGMVCAALLGGYYYYGHRAPSDHARQLNSEKVTRPPGPDIGRQNEPVSNTMQEGQNNTSAAVSPCRKTSNPAAKISITGPCDGARVEYRDFVEGTVSDPKATVWVIVHPQEVGDFWVQPSVTVRSDGKWRVLVNFGDPPDSGKPYEVAAVANPRAPLIEGEMLRSWPDAQSMSDPVDVVRK